MPNVKLTESFVLKCGSEGRNYISNRNNKSQSNETFYWDTEITGLALRVWSSGKKVYIIQHRNKQTQKIHKVTLGNSSTLELKQARDLASKHIYECNAEILVNGIRSITLKDLSQLYLKERYGKKKSLDQDEYNIKKYILPVLGNKIVKTISTQDIVELQHKLYPRKVTANQVRGILNLLFKFAIDVNYAKDKGAGR